MKEELKLRRIGNNKDLSELPKTTNRIEFEHNNRRYTITPDFKGFRIHLHDLESDGIMIYPSCANEIIIR